MLVIAQQSFNRFLAGSFGLHLLLAILFVALPRGEVDGVVGGGYKTVSLNLVKRSSNPVIQQKPASKIDNKQSKEIVNKDAYHMNPEKKQFASKPSEPVVPINDVADNNQEVLIAGQDSKTTIASTAMKGMVKDYTFRLQAWLEQKKRYPRKALERSIEGQAMLSFAIDRSGNVQHYNLQKSSGFELLDNEVLQMVKRASPFPRVPDNYPASRLSFTVPVNFAIN